MSEKLEPLIASDPNELRELATAPDGSLVRLSKEQLRGIRYDGTFEVASINFVGAVHCWRISQLLQKGSHRANEELKEALARAYYFTFILARDRVIGDSFSLKGAIKQFGYSVYFVYNLLIGGQLRRSRFTPSTALLSSLVCGLKTDCNLSLTKKNLDLLLRDGRSLKQGGGYELTLKDSLVPHVYTNSSGANVNLLSVSSFWVKSLSSSVRAEIFMKAREATKEKYPTKYVQELIKEYQTQGLSSEEITKFIRDRYDVDFLNELVTSFKEHPAITDVLPLGQGGVIESYLQGLKAAHVSFDNEKVRIEERVSSRIEELKRNSSIRSKCEKWLEEQKVKATLAAATEEDSFENIRQMFNSNTSIGSEWLYFLNICEEFNRDLVRIKGNDAKMNFDVETESFSRKILNPRNYIVTNIETGERIKKFTILSNKQPYSESIGPHCRYDMTKSFNHTVTTKYPGWRWRMLFISNYSWLMNVLYVLFLGLVLKGPFSLSALFLCYEHPTEYSVDIDTGDLYVSKRGKTLFTRLVGLWVTIREKRHEFESRPDTGFLPKNFSRIVNWSYYNIVWGVIGSILLVIVFTLICTFIINLGIVLILTMPIWFLLLRIFLVFVRWMFYDWEYFDPIEANSRGHIMPIFYLVIYKIFLLVFLQFLFAISAIFTLPFVSLFWAITAFIFRIVRFFWDNLLYYLIIRNRGRIPVTDSFVARRISGPGLATNYYYQIDPNQVLIKLEFDLESKELHLYEDFMTCLIDRPRLTYVNFITKVLSSFGYSGRNEENTTFLEILNQKRKLMEQLKTAMKDRRNYYTLNTSGVNLNSIRMTEEDLGPTISLATEIVKEFYLKRILIYPSQTMDKIFSKKGLEHGDWENLAKIELKNSFSPQFLTYLEESDESFHLQVNRLRIHEYFKHLRHGKPRHHLDQERLIMVDQNKIFLPGIDLSPSYTDNWVIASTQGITKYHSGTKKSEHLLFPPKFNDKMIIFALVVENMGWENVIKVVGAGESDDSVATKKHRWRDEFTLRMDDDISLRMDSEYSDYD